MRLRTFSFTVVWVVVLAYLAWSAVGAGAIYFAAKELAESAVWEASKRHRAAATGQSDAGIEEFASDVRGLIVRGVRRGGLAIDERLIAVTPGPRVLRVTMSWTYPVLSYGGTPVVAIPLSLDRSFDLRP